MQKNVSQNIMVETSILISHNTIMKWIIHVLKQMALKLLVEDLVTYVTL